MLHGRGARCRAATAAWRAAAARGRRRRRAHGVRELQRRVGLGDDASTANDASPFGDDASVGTFYGIASFDASGVVFCGAANFDAGPPLADASDEGSAVAFYGSPGVPGSGAGPDGAVDGSLGGSSDASDSG